MSFRAIQWTSSFDKKNESPVVHRWVRLSNLPINFCAPKCMEGIGNAITKFVAVDERTIRKISPGTDRLCIELDLSKPIPQRVWLGTSIDKGFWQRIITEGRLDYCTVCELHGHNVEICRNAAAKNVDKIHINKNLFCNRCRINNHSTSDCKWNRKPVQMKASSENIASKSSELNTTHNATDDSVRIISTGMLNSNKGTVNAQTGSDLIDVSA